LKIQIKLLGAIKTMKRSTILIIGGAVVILLIALGVGAFFLLPSLTAASQANTTATPTVAPTPTQTVNKIAQDLRQNAPTIKSQIAQGLKLTPDQLTAQLQAGKTLSQVAAAQGISPTQLQTIVTNAIETGMQPAVADGDLTQTQLDRLAKRYANNPDLLDRLLGGKAVKRNQATPTPTIPSA
jgi:flagellar basal body-associated protein FliL